MRQERDVPNEHVQELMEFYKVNTKYCARCDKLTCPDDIESSTNILQTNITEQAERIEALEVELAQHEINYVLEAADHKRTKAKADSVIESAKVSSQASRTVLSDWLHIYADDMCEPEKVEESRARINVSGTLAYIANVQVLNRKTLAAIEAYQKG